MAALIEVKNPWRLLKEEGIAQVPVSGYEKNLLNGCGFQYPFKEGREELINEVSLIREHVFISFCRRKRRKKIAPDHHDL